MSRLQVAADAMTTVTNTMIDHLLPQFVTSAGGDEAVARTLIKGQIAPYCPAPIPKPLRVGRIIGFRTAAIDSLRLSITDDQTLPDTTGRWNRAAIPTRGQERPRQDLARSQAGCRAAMDSVQAEPVAALSGHRRRWLYDV